MPKFEYQISKYDADSFADLVYFCTPTGECDLQQVPRDQVQALSELLNAKGQQGWELIQLSFGQLSSGKPGVLAFWKRQLPD